MDTHTPQITEQEKDFLEKYDNENPFLKSLSDFYKERGSISEKQILALRKETQKDRTEYSHCEVLHLTQKQECVFHDKIYKEHKKVIIRQIRNKAIELLDEKNNVYAWMPKSAVEVEVEIDKETGEETSVLYLKTWFTRDDDFWKQNKPFASNQKQSEENKEDKRLIEEKANALMDLDVNEEDFSDEIETYEEDDKLPF